MKNTHLTSDFLELYALNRIDGAAEAQVEEHLLVCGRCMHRMERIEQKILIIQTALAADVASLAV
ncbi:MAG: zf-HC2 domain-containing protein [Acidobacteriota bacterium]|nr:zf-HC2 domain-containing protein [Acidobacteriota bacterium]